MCFAGGVNNFFKSLWSVVHFVLDLEFFYLADFFFQLTVRFAIILAYVVYLFSPLTCFVVAWVALRICYPMRLDSVRFFRLFLVLIWFGVSCSFAWLIIGLSLGFVSTS